MILKKMAFTTTDGVEHPDAVWRLVALHATLDGVRVVFYGYHSQETLSAGAQPLSGAIKEYSLPAATISEHAELETGINLAAWGIALSTLESAKPKEGEGDTRKSFFEGATDV